MLSVIIKDSEGGAIKCVWYNMLIFESIIKNRNTLCIQGKSEP